MSKPRLELKVGIFVVLCLAVFVGLVLTFSKGFTILRSTYHIKLRTSNVGGIRPQAGVLMAGVPVGSVDRTELAPDGKSVVIHLRLLQQFQVHRDATFVIEQSGFLGDQYVAIYPKENKGTMLQDGEETRCEEPFNMQEVARNAAGFILRIDETAQRLNKAIQRMDNTVFNEHTLTNLAAAVDLFRAASDEVSSTLQAVKSLVTTNGPAIAVTISNLNAFSVHLTKAADNLDQLISTNSTTITGTLSNLNAVSQDARQLMSDVESGKGVAGSLFKDDQLRQSVSEMTRGISQTASNLSITTSNINKRGIWGVLWKPKDAETNRTPMHPPVDPRRPK